MKAFKILLPVLTLCLLIAGCAQPKALEYRGVDNLRIQNLSLSQSSVLVDVSFYNPNAYSLDLKGGNIDIYINGHNLGKSSVNTTVIAPQLNTFVLPLAVTANLQSIFQGALSLLTNKDVELKLNGNVQVGKGGLFINLPVNIVTRQPIKIR